MRALVIGYGSIGKRHRRVLEELGFSVSVVSSQRLADVDSYPSLEAFLKINNPDYVVIANATHLHWQSLRQLREKGLNIPVLVEKPLAVSPFEYDPNLSESNTYVGYNLRFHPVVRRVRQELQGQKVLSAQFYVGQYLPLWRPGTDYKKSYSAKVADGGGVIRDLSHELDLMTCLFGRWQSVYAKTSRSHLEIESESVCAGFMAAAACPLITFEMNYLDRIIRRAFTINTDEKTLHSDLINNQLTINGEIITFTVERDDTYRLQHASVLAGESECCSFLESLEVVRLIAGIETSHKEGKVVHNENALHDLC